VARILITDAAHFLGPASAARLRDAGHDVVTVEDRLTSRQQVIDLVSDRGPFEGVVANLDAAATVASITAHTDLMVDDVLDRLVRPLYWILGAALPSMVTAGDGAVVVATSATALRSGRHTVSAYEMARSAQTAVVRSAGREMAAHGVRVNAVAPNYVENPSYYPPELVADERFQRAVEREVPAGRLGSGDEAASVVEYLLSPGARYLFGAVLPVDGGWSLG
jgi:NAD(P)-dependent dehydrogenase (short-subunit alcohol dehydrogenase family)